MAPGTGTPEPCGLTSRQLLDVVRRPAYELPIVGAEVVEVAPGHDHADITAMLGSRIVLEARHFELDDQAVRRAPGLHLEGSTRPRPTHAYGDRWSASAFESDDETGPASDTPPGDQGPACSAGGIDRRVGRRRPGPFTARCEPSVAEARLPVRRTRRQVLDEASQGGDRLSAGILGSASLRRHYEPPSRLHAPLPCRPPCRPLLTAAGGARPAVAPAGRRESGVTRWTRSWGVRWSCSSRA
ncbi:arginase family protein [Embleya sp. NPDC059237]|uniref:arginase family protein n=1 Tax=Embleya sp. NPDC059237 TaxID=3346784 RepID=UPI00368717FF